MQWERRERFVAVPSHKRRRKSHLETQEQPIHGCCFNQALQPISVIHLVKELARGARKSAESLTIWLLQGMNSILAWLTENVAKTQSFQGFIETRVCQINADL